MTTSKDCQTGSQQDLIRRRTQLLGPKLSLSYENPLHLVRGEDVWLYDADGRAYLDAYNNVAHVGHCHADVVAAIARQAARLNTNTRYLHETVLDLSEYLTAKLPSGLDVCFFVNSGSEANDIAWQMTKAFSGNTGVLVLDEAYHGISEATFAMSSSEYDAANQPDHVETLESPDSYHGRLRGNSPEVGIGYTESCDQAIAALAQRGHAPAALIIDSGTSSSGILDLPEGYLPTITKKVQAAGGLYIADEVQVGLGRSGSHFWGFEALGAKPDIVTIGKPIGNGHPIGIVVTSREILAKFNGHVPFFSTFGGNPVSAAAGLEVLKVIDRQNLQQNARETSTYLKQGIKDLAEREILIGDVRGLGLLIGIDLVLDRETREPAGKAANQIFNHMRNNGVLIGTAGPHGNVLKIRPPMTFSKAHADQLITTLADALNALG
jgi:4-aminobutyrate aminotransferase-like enzyme